MATKKTTTVKEKKVAAPKVAKVKAAPKAEKVEKPVVAAPKIEKAAPKERYFYAVGRRKTAVAQVRLFADGKSESFEVTVNNRPYLEYFNTFEQREAVVAPLKAVGKDKAIVSVHVMGGGLSGQADAVKLGIARALIVNDPLLRAVLKVQKLLTRDPRSVERKKPGLRKARRAPQWSKR